jgi:hypothetical protein
MEDFHISSCSNLADFFILLSSIPGFLKARIRSNGSFDGGFVVFLDVSSDFNARHAIHVRNIRLNGQCGIFHDCEAFGNEIFALRLTAATDYVGGRTLRNPVIVTGLAFADDAIRSKAAPATGGNPSSAECPGVLVVPRRPPRQASRPTSAHGEFRVVQSAFGGPHLATESKASK